MVVAFKLLSLLEVSPEDFERTALLLESYWPGNEIKIDGIVRTGIQRRKEKLEKLSKQKKEGFVFYMNDSVLGYFCLQKAKTKIGEFSCAITSVIIDKNHRKKGYGRSLMNLAFKIAKEKKYMYMYLWTNDAVGFYKKCGFFVCDKVNMDSPVLNRLNNVGLLLGKLNARFQERAELSKGTDVDAKESDTWMKYRLRECDESITRELESLLSEVEGELKSLKTPGGHFLYHVNNVPWYRQIGPSCGFQCLRTAKEYFSGSSTHLQDLINPSKSKGYTVDGEIFQMSHLAAIARDMLGLEACVLAARSLLDVRRMCIEVLKGNLIIFPYDKSSQKSRPGTFGGLNAHYASLVGFALVSRTEGLELRTDVIESCEMEDIYLVAQHGLSKRVLIAKAMEMMGSNGQLNMRTSRLTQDESEKIIDLKEKCLLIKKNPN